ncbi:MAG: hypothetical protein M0R00_01340 [Candidatus Omnitrophica bacterium]|jgi:hypothetical protein|nr:hypothetical protein [Candidatus Omnitrophota bacterium]
MTASEIIKSEGLQLIRERKVEHAKGEPWQYDVKEAFTGSKKGFVYLDAFTKNAMRTVYNAMKDEQKAIYDNIHIKRLIDFTWKCVS